ncbi:MAG: PEP-CTERM sorting domain-containing protein [Phycisphaerae bacterium]|nr:PEP-CTERM sorting domain-containing protein [Phycisphaerae bacterium]
MNAKWSSVVLCMALLAALATPQLAPAQSASGNLILNVPDWNQPTNYGVGGYPGWCSPTSGANLMGYWEDVMGCSGLTDQQAFTSSPGYPNTSGTWQQGLYHDGMVEMGWHMDTGSWQSTPGPFPPNSGSTTTANILPGLLSYATGGWTDNDYAGGGGAGTGIVKTAYASATGYTDAVAGTPLGTMWLNYVGEIDAAHPVECTFDKWVNSGIVSQSWTLNGQTVDEHPWQDSDPHSVVGVGYIDPNPGYDGDGSEYFVCQDNWQTTGQYVAVPVDTVWLQNDYITDVPEPATMALLAAGAFGLIRRRRRRN